MEKADERIMETVDGAKWTMKGKDIPYALSDILSLTFDDVFDLFFAKEGETLHEYIKENGKSFELSEEQKELCKMLSNY